MKFIVPMKYRICRRYSPLAVTWYIIQKRTLFGWHTLNISFANLHSANKYLPNEVKLRDEICETPLEWNKKKQRFYEKYPCKTNLIDENGVEFWFGRELAPYLGYAQWRNFESVIEKAKDACKTASGDVLSNFADVSKIVKTGVAEKEVQDVKLTRYLPIIEEVEE